MSEIRIESEIIRELAHSGVKTLGSLAGLMEFYDVYPTGGFHDAKTRKLFRRSVQSLQEAIEDLRLLVICETTTAKEWGRINWKTLLEANLTERYSKSSVFSAGHANFDGEGHSDLLEAAVHNMGWFARRFWKEPIKVKLDLVRKTGVEPQIRVIWDFGNSVAIPPDFSALTPFTSMVPKESLALDKSTGLVLVAVKRILELHGGSLTANADAKHLIMEWICPRKSTFSPKP